MKTRQKAGGSVSSPALSLDLVLGQTCLANSALAVNPATGDVAYPAGCVVVVYQPRRNRQVRYFRAGKAVSCLAFSRDGSMLAVGERGQQPSIIVWDTATGAVSRELKGGHRYGVGCIAFSPRGDLLVSCGFKSDRSLQLWDLGIGSGADEAAGRVQRSDGASAASDGHARPFVPGPGLPLAGRARRVACARVGQKMRAVAFSEDGTFFVTCGERHVKFWSLEADGSAPACPNSADVGGGGENAGVAVLEGRPASILEALRDATFMDVACRGSGKGQALSPGAEVYCVTSTGLLCAFSRERVMEQWLSLEAPSAYSLSLCDDGMLAVGCADGLVRLFATDTLCYIATLPRPPPLGRVNVTSMAQLQAEAKAAAAAANSEQNGENQEGERAASEAPLRYPAALAVRLLPSSAKVVVTYADRSLFIWDAADPHSVGKYRSFLHHSGCVWDVQCLPTASKAPGLGPQVIATCSADKTIRLWDLAALDGPTAGGLNASGSVAEAPAGASGARWTNIYSKYMLRVLYVDSRRGIEEDGGDRVFLAAEGAAKDARASGGDAGSGADRELDPGAQSSGIPNTEIPPKPEWPAAPRSLAIHPQGTEVAIGDKCGNLKVFDLTTMRLRHAQAAHDAEILALSYSPALVAERAAAAKRGDTAAAAPDVFLLASAGRDRLVHVFNASDGALTAPTAAKNGHYPLLETLDMHSSSVMGLKFTKDGRRLVSAGGDKMVCISEVRGLRVARRQAAAAAAPGTIYGLDVDPTSRFLVTAGQDKRLNIWSLATGRLTRAYRADGAPGQATDAGESSGSGGELFKVDLDPAGMYAATCSFDKWIRLFDFFSGRCLARVAGHSELVTGVRFSTDGRRLISIGGDGCIFVWRLSTELHKAMTERMAEMRPVQRSPQQVWQSTASSTESAEASDAAVQAKARQDAMAKLLFHASKLPSWAHTRNAGVTAYGEEAVLATEDAEDINEAPLAGDGIVIEAHDATGGEEDAGAVVQSEQVGLHLAESAAEPALGSEAKRWERAASRVGDDGAPSLPPVPLNGRVSGDGGAVAGAPSSPNAKPEAPAEGLVLGEAAHNAANPVIETYEDDFEADGAPASNGRANGEAAVQSLTLAPPAAENGIQLPAAGPSVSPGAQQHVATGTDSDEAGEGSSFFQSGDTDAELSLAFRMHPSAAAAMVTPLSIASDGGGALAAGADASPEEEFEKAQDSAEQWWGQQAGCGGSGDAQQLQEELDGAIVDNTVVVESNSGASSNLSAHAAVEAAWNEVPPPPPPPRRGTAGPAADVSDNEAVTDAFPPPPPPPPVPAASKGAGDVAKKREKRRETEDAVAKMRQRLSAMGLLPSPASAASDVVATAGSGTASATAQASASAETSHNGIEVVAATAEALEEDQGEASLYDSIDANEAPESLANPKDSSGDRASAVAQVEPVQERSILSAALPRQQDEYTRALAGLQEAAAHASALYRELESSGAASRNSSWAGRKASFQGWDQALPAAGVLDGDDCAAESLLHSFRESFAHVSGMLGATGALSVPLGRSEIEASAFGSSGNAVAGGVVSPLGNPRLESVLEHYSEALLQAFERRMESIVVSKVPQAVQQALQKSAELTRDGDESQPSREEV